MLEKGRQWSNNTAAVACHSQDGSTRLGPTWKGLYGRTEQFADGSSALVDEAYLKESILEPQARLVQGYPPVMVAYTLSDDELRAVVAVIKSLGAAPQNLLPAKSWTGVTTWRPRGSGCLESLGCLACHSVDGSKASAPAGRACMGSSTDALPTDTSIKVDEGYIKDSILNPGARIVKGYAAVMPALYPD